MRKIVLLALIARFVLMGAALAAPETPVSVAMPRPIGSQTTTATYDIRTFGAVGDGVTLDTKTPDARPAVVFVDVSLNFPGLKTGSTDTKPACAG